MTLPKEINWKWTMLTLAIPLLITFILLLFFNGTIEVQLHDTYFVIDGYLIWKAYTFISSIFLLFYFLLQNFKLSIFIVGVQQFSLHVSFLSVFSFLFFGVSDVIFVGESFSMLLFYNLCITQPLALVLILISVFFRKK